MLREWRKYKSENLGCGKRAMNQNGDQVTSNQITERSALSRWSSSLDIKRGRWVLLFSRLKGSLFLSTTRQPKRPKFRKLERFPVSVVKSESPQLFQN